jgi:hypothetical protein
MEWRMEWGLKLVLTHDLFPYAAGAAAPAAYNSALKDTHFDYFASNHRATVLAVREGGI